MVLAISSDELKVAARRTVWGYSRPIARLRRCLLCSIMGQKYVEEFSRSCHVSAILCGYQRLIVDEEDPVRAYKAGRKRT